MFLILTLFFYIAAIVCIFTGNSDQSIFNFVILGTMFLNAHQLMQINLSLEKSKKEAVKTLSDVIVTAKLLDIASKGAESKEKDQDTVNVKD